MTTLTQMLFGRKRESGIWDYFTYKTETEQSTRQYHGGLFNSDRMSQAGGK